MNLYDLQVKIGLDSTAVTKGIASAGTELKNFGGKIKDGAEQLAKVGAAAIGAASAGVAALAKSATEAYADYEQLVGGVEKLFGESADLMMMYAQDAYKTAGMSVNEYMETATSFAAALTSSVQAAGGSMDEAVEYADTAMRDMSDNANTFGTDMASIQNAYQGFAKQNYTMLDNLKLGYGGTKAEMERLIEDANKLRREQGINNDLTVESYADIITAIHEVQTAMNITGTTSREASKTISGSINAAKAAWKNLTVEIAKDDGDINSAFNALGGTVGDVIDNIIPRVEKAVGGIGGLISTAAPQVIKGINSLLPKVLPSLIKSAGSVLSAVGQGLFEATPAMLELGKNALQNLAEGIQNAEFDSSGILGKVFDSVVNNIPEYLNYASTILSNLANAFLNIDFAKLGSSLSTVIKSSINSVSDFLANVDMQKVGKDIGDFISNIDWKGIAESVINLLGSAIGSLGDIAEGFFENMDGATLFTAIGVLGAPKLLGGLNQFMGSSEGQSLGKTAGSSWSSAFMAGIEAFGLGWTIGTYLRDNIKIGDKTLGEWVDQKVDEGLSGKDEEGNYKGGFMGALAKAKDYYELADKADSYTDERGNSYYTVGLNGEESEAVKKRIAAQNAVNLKETFKYYANGSLQSAYKYNVNGELSNEWKKYGGLAFGDGGRVTKPTFALIGEKEPETIVPDSKRGEFGTTNYNTINVYIDGTGKNAEEIADEAIEVISTKLDILGIQQQRAVGGKSWA